MRQRQWSEFKWVEHFWLLTVKSIFKKRFPLHTEAFDRRLRTPTVHEISQLARGACHFLKRQTSDVGGVWFEKVERKSAGLWSLTMCFDSSTVSSGKKCFRWPLGGQMTDKWERARLTCTNRFLFIYLFTYFPWAFLPEAADQQRATSKMPVFTFRVYVLPFGFFFLFVVIFYVQCESQFDLFLGKKKATISYNWRVNQQQPE